MIYLTIKYQNQINWVINYTSSQTIQYEKLIQVLHDLWYQLIN